MKINVKKIKTGEKYWFPNTDFSYGGLFKTYRTLERIYQVIGNEFSTRNEGDRYEVVRSIGFSTEREAKDYLIKRVSERLKEIKAEAKEAIRVLKLD